MKLFEFSGALVMFFIDHPNPSPDCERLTTEPIEHDDQFLSVDSGVFPNYIFVRALRDSLTNDFGSIFRYADHESSVLNNIYNQLAESDEKDKNELMEFIHTITHSTKDSVDSWEGESGAKTNRLVT